MLYFKTNKKRWNLRRQEANCLQKLLRYNIKKAKDCLFAKQKKLWNEIKLVAHTFKS